MPSVPSVPSVSSVSVSLHERSTVVHLEVGGERVSIVAASLPTTGVGKRRFLLLHGNPSHMEHFAANIEWLRSQGDVALFDLPGFGASATPHHALTLDFYADVAAAFVDSIGWSEGVDVIGQSHGGAVAQTLAARKPSLVRSVILLGTMGYPAHFSMRMATLPGAEAVTVGITQRAHRFPFGMFARAFARVELRASFDPDPIPSGFLAAELARIVARPEIQRSCIRANDGNPTHQLAAQAKHIVAPILVIHGTGDRLVPIGYARRLFALIGQRNQGSKMFEVAGGHMVHLSRPDSVHMVMGEWLIGK